LRRVEHGEPFEKGDGLRLFAGLAGTLPLVLGNEAVGINDGGAAFALANIAAKGKGLPEG
jgi:hypothetical protein